MSFSILAIFTVQDHQIEKFKSALLKNAAHSREENGCLAYLVHSDAASANVFFLYEKYATKEDYEFHRTTDHLREFRETMTPLLAQEPVIYRGVEI